MPSLLKDVGYEPIKDFTGVSLMVDVPLVVLVNADLPVKTLAQLLALGSGGSDKLTYGSAGIGSAPHMAAAMLFLQSGVTALHVPFKGNAPAPLEVMAGRVTTVVDTVAAAASHIKSGKLRALAVTSAKRSASMLDVPTVAESGVLGYALTAFNGIAVPAGTPPVAIERLHAAIVKAMTPELRAKLLKDGAELQASPRPQQFSDFIRQEVTSYAKVIKDLNIKAE